MKAPLAYLRTSFRLLALGLKNAALLCKILVPNQLKCIYILTDIFRGNISLLGYIIIKDIHPSFAPLCT